MPFGLWFGDSHLGFGTHMPILTAAVLAARPGPVLEYGVGLYSTPLLHLLCEEMDRKLLSLESDEGWLARFVDLQTDNHRLIAFPSWEESEGVVDAQTWAVAFIDHGPEERRVVDAKRLASRTEFVVVHDWDGAAQAGISKLFRYRWESKRGPRTAVLSNIRPFRLF